MHSRGAGAPPCSKGALVGARLKLGAPRAPLVAAVVMLFGGFAGPHVGSAQADRVDAGSFTILKDGRRVGREQFSWRRAPSTEGVAYELRGETTTGEQQTTVQLSTDSTGSPIRYAVEVRDSLTVTLRLGGQRVRGRFATLARRPQGEAAREYLLPAGGIVLEADVFHQLCFVLRARALTPGGYALVPSIAPLGGSQQELKVVLESPNDSVTIAGQRRPARRWRLEQAGRPARTVWGDGEGRVLRVLVAAESIEAVRDDIPR